MAPVAPGSRAAPSTLQGRRRVRAIEFLLRAIQPRHSTHLVPRDQAGFVQFCQLAGEAGLDLRIDSAGTSAEERGNRPSHLAARAAGRRGWRMPKRFDHRLAMTGSHLAAPRRAAPAGTAWRIGLPMEHGPEAGGQRRARTLAWRPVAPGRRRTGSPT
jgi:hypothetical protein